MSPPPDEAAARDDWVRLAQKALGGRPLESLDWRTEDGLVLPPVLPRVAEAVPIPGRVAGEPWTVVQRVDHPDPGEANRFTLLDLANGASGLALVFSGAASADGFGVLAGTLPEVLDGVHLDLIRLQIEAAPFEAGAAAEAIVALVEARGLAPASLDISFGLDPLGDAAGAPLREGWRNTLSDAVGRLRAADFRSPLLRADGRPYHAAGASDAQELATVLATALDYVRTLEDAGLEAPEALRSVAFRLVAGADQFSTIAKLRAARLLWARLVEELGVPGLPVRLEAETAWRELTRHDPWTNVLRGTIAAYAAGVGSADTLIVLPFTQALGLPDEAARRLARNTQLVLIEEANLHRVADPATGSGSLEALTEALAARAWDLFRDVERAGGMAAALASGLVQGTIAETRASRERQVASGAHAIIGTNAYPDLTELPVAVAERSHPRAVSGPLPRRRLAEPFEALRERAEARRRETGGRPLVFLAALGAESAARATFAADTFALGGFASLQSPPFGTPEEAAAAFSLSGASLACLCAADATYDEMAGKAARHLKAAGARAIFLAGPPAGREGLRADGIDDFVYAGCSLTTLLERAHDILDQARSGGRTG